MKSIVSIIIPVYTVSEEYLRKCIESIIGQTLKELEIILVDDGSPDNCGAICDEYASKDSRIKVFHKENGGVSSARNLGLENATGQYIMFVDADDWLEQCAVETCLLYQQDYHTDFIAFGYYINDDAYQIKRIKRLSKIECAMAIAGRKRYVMGYLWNKLFVRDIIISAKLKFDETLAICEDSLFCQEYTIHCNNIVCVPEVLYHYTVSDISATHNKFSKKNCTVFKAYKKIINFCDKSYSNRSLKELLYGNYYSHYIQSLRRIKNELTTNERKGFCYLYEFVKENIFGILKNRYIKLKRKILAIYLILFMKNSYE